MNRTLQPFVIANGASLSGAVDLRGLYVIRLSMPAGWTAAGITFALSDDGSTFNPLCDADGNEITLTVAASKHIALDPADLVGDCWLKIRSGTSAAAVNQGAERTVVLKVREI